MSKRTPTRPADTNQLAHMIVGIATGEVEDQAPPEPDAAHQAAGKAGGKARAKVLTDEQRAEIARKAAAARWDKS